MIERITIRNFKSIGDVTVDLSPVTVLIGRSGTGKSNFLRAIRFVRNSLLHPDNAVAAEGGWARIWPFGKSAPLEITATFSLPGYERPFAYDVRWDRLHANNPNPVLHSEALTAGDDVLFSRKADKFEVWPVGKPPPGQVYEARLGTFPTITEAVLSFTAWTSGIGWHDFPANVLSKTGAGQPSSSQGLDDAADNYLTVLRDLTQDLRDQHARRQILARARQINHSVRSIELDSVRSPTRIVVGHELGTQVVPLDISQESDGFRRYYAHLLAIYQTPPKQTLMLEEPENGIFPGALRNLAEEFVAAPKAGRGQILLTTQSPQLLDGFNPEDIRVVDIDPVSQQTRIGPLDPDQAAAVRDALLAPGELLTVDQARIAPQPAPAGVPQG